MLIIFLPKALAFDERDNYREQCRSYVSGRYLLLYNDRDAMGQKFEASSQKLIQLKKPGQRVLRSLKICRPQKSQVSLIGNLRKI